MKIVKNRFFIALVCLIMAGIISFLLLPQLYQSRQATAVVFRAATDIPSGTLIESKHIWSVEVGAFNLPDGVYTDSADIIGQYALTDIPKDDLILTDKIGEFLFTEMLDSLMKQNKRLVTVTLPSTAAGVSGHLQSGDIVSVICYVEAHERLETDPETGFDIRVAVPAETIVLPELQSITVFSVENAKTESLEDVRGVDGNASDPVPKTVTLIVSEEQALKLVDAEYTGKIHLIFVRRDA